MNAHQVRRLMGQTMGVGSLAQCTQAAEDFARGTGGVFYVYDPCGKPVAGFDGRELEPIPADELEAAITMGEL